ncbi:hypothetical protein HPB47_007757 [Ixodes persulcatus]|uniref:Uncharacterized protein n=1 Tax=Ixodes persulcatus TaxID=34615 RepID=A0AC60P6W7_IXOPE|nr:hypothetical protein HPB47_007757 [Ixodes persulcatus]
MHAAGADVEAVDIFTATTSKRPKSPAVPGDASASHETKCSARKTGEDSSKHASVFNKSWLRDYPWLLYDDDDIKGGMFCKLRMKYDKRPSEKSVWNEEPCKRTWLESIRKHEACCSHRDSVALEEHSKVVLSPLETLKCPASRSAMKQAFTNLYFLCKHKIAHTTNYEPLHDLRSVMGLDVKPQIAPGKNATYCSQRSIQEMVACLSGVIEDDILYELQQSEHYALMFDETTDCSTVEQLVIHCRYIFNGNLKVKFLSMIDVLGSPDLQLSEERSVALNATNIASAVEGFMTKKGLVFETLRGIGTDGAPVMTGKKSGAVKLLTDKQKAVTAPQSSQAVGIHCGAHRLNLAANQAAKAVPYVDKFKDLLRRLYSFYASSSVRTAGLSAVQKILDTEQGVG